MFHEVEYILLFGTSNSSPRIFFPREMKTYVYKISCEENVQSSFIHKSQYWKQLTCSLLSEW